MFLAIENLSDDEINDRLVADALPPASPDYLGSFRRTLNLPMNFDPSDRQHLGTRAFLVRHNVSIFFQANGTAASEVMRLLRSPRAREIVEAALIVEVPSKFVVHVLARHLGYKVTEQTLDDYAAVFFDTSRVDRSTLRTLVEARVRHAILHVVGQEDGVDVRHAVAADARVVAANLPRASLSWRSVLLALGITAPDLNVTTTIAELERMALTRAGEALARGAYDDARRAESFVGIVERIRALREGLTDPNEAIVKSLSQLRVVQSSEPMTTVAQLMGRGDEVSTLQEGPADHEASDDDVASAPSPTR